MQDPRSARQAGVTIPEEEPAPKPPMTTAPAEHLGTRDRETLARRSVRLNAATLAYNSLEAAVALAAGAAAGSIALVGFGLDSLIELAASLTALWRLRADVDIAAR